MSMLYTAKMNVVGDIKLVRLLEYFCHWYLFLNNPHAVESICTAQFNIQPRNPEIFFRPSAYIYICMYQNKSGFVSKFLVQYFIQVFYQVQINSFLSQS